MNSFNSFELKDISEQCKGKNSEFLTSSYIRRWRQTPKKLKKIRSSKESEAEEGIVVEFLQLIFNEITSTSCGKGVKQNNKNIIRIKI